MLKAWDTSLDSLCNAHSTHVKKSIKLHYLAKYSGFNGRLVDKRFGCTFLPFIFSIPGQMACHDVNLICTTSFASSCALLV
jgi:hypothetical protein